jgi:hypothetical protein
MSFAYSFERLGARPELLPETYHLGRYTVRGEQVSGVYARQWRVFLGGKFLGAQISRPTVEDCDRMRLGVGPLKHHDPTAKYRSRAQKGYEAMKRRGSKGKSLSIKLMGTPDSLG